MAKHFQKETVFGKFFALEKIFKMVQIKIIISDHRTESNERPPDSPACCAKSTAAMLLPSNSSSDL